jgi:hypothetical protein
MWGGKVHRVSCIYITENGFNVNSHMLSAFPALRECGVNPAPVALPF